MSKWKNYPFRLTKQSIYNSELFQLPIGNVRAQSDGEARQSAKREATRVELHLGASMIVKIELKIGDEWVEVK